MEQQGARGRIDNYQIIERAPHSPAARQFLVWDISRKQPVMLKIAVGATGESPVSVLNETWILGRLNHLGVPSLVDFGLTADGRPWFVATPVRSRTVASGRSMFLALEVAELIRELALILDHAHQHGVVVRSLRPDAITLADRAEGTHTMIVDWSDAQICGQRAPVLTGDPGFLAPELARGLASDQRGDIYALGAVAYWALTGATATTPIAIGTVGGKPITSAYVPSSQRCPGAPPALTTLVDHMVALDPWNRPASCIQIHDEAVKILGEHTQNEQKSVKWLASDFLDTETDAIETPPH